MSVTPSIGDAILDEIIKSGLVRAEFINGNTLFIWQGNAAEQLEALVTKSAIVQIPIHEASLYGQVLQILGAPDGDNPKELLQWAEASKAKLISP